MVEGIEHKMDHFSLVFGRALVFLNKPVFYIIHVDLEIQHALEPVAIDAVIGVGAGNGIGSPGARETHSAQVEMFDRKPAVVPCIAALFDLDR